MIIYTYSIIYVHWDWKYDMETMTRTIYTIKDIVPWIIRVSGHNKLHLFIVKLILPLQGRNRGRSCRNGSTRYF